jgi:hypothetical protein
VTDDGQTSNIFQFLWHELFFAAVIRMAPAGVTDLIPEGVTHLSPKESQFEESHIEEKTTNKRIPGHASQKTRSAANSIVSSEESETQNLSSRVRSFAAPRPGFARMLAVATAEQKRIIPL